MLEDEVLKLRFKCGSQAALERIYEKYVDQMLTVAVGLVHEIHTAEDAVHDAFVRFAQSRERFRLQGNLKRYLTACVVNRVRDVMRQRQTTSVGATARPDCSTPGDPYECVVCNELSQYVHDALEKLPYEQREALVLHVKADMSFAEIAKLQSVTLRTAQGRYRYGMNKLRHHLNGRVQL